MKGGRILICPRVIDRHCVKWEVSRNYSSVMISYSAVASIRSCLFMFLVIFCLYICFVRRETSEQNAKKEERKAWGKEGRVKGVEGG